MGSALPAVKNEFKKVEMKQASALVINFTPLLLPAS